MSYSILYQSVWIKHPDDRFTLFQLVGDNNVYVTNRKRYRSWNLQFAYYTKEQVETYYSSWFGSEFQQLFQYHGKWVDDNRLRSMIKNGMKNAIPADDFFSRYSVSCCRRIYDTKTYNSESDMNFCAKNEADFVDWVNRADQPDASKKIYLECSPSYGDEPIKLPPRSNNLSDNESVVVEFGKGKYLFDVRPGNGYTYGPDFGNALVYASVEEARIATKGIYSNSFHFISYEKRLASLNAKEYVVRNKKEGWYVTKATSRRIFGTRNIKSARKQSKSSAVAFVKKYGESSYEVVSINEL